MMTIHFRKCISQHMKFGRISERANINIDLFVFSPPEYFRYHDNPLVYPELKKFEFAFHVFEIINN